MFLSVSSIYNASHEFRYFENDKSCIIWSWRPRRLIVLVHDAFHTKITNLRLDLISSEVDDALGVFFFIFYFHTNNKREIFSDPPFSLLLNSYIYSNIDIKLFGKRGHLFTTTVQFPTPFCSDMIGIFDCLISRFVKCISSLSANYLLNSFIPKHCENS